MWLRVGRRWLPTWLPRHSLAVLTFEWPHTHLVPGPTFLSRHEAVGADVMLMSPEA